MLQTGDLPERVRLLSAKREGGVAPRPMDCDAAYYVARLAEEQDSEGGCGGGEEGAKGGDGTAEGYAHGQGESASCCGGGE